MRRSVFRQLCHRPNFVAYKQLCTARPYVLPKVVSVFTPKCTPFSSTTSSPSSISVPSPTLNTNNTTALEDDGDDEARQMQSLAYQMVDSILSAPSDTDLDPAQDQFTSLPTEAKEFFAERPRDMESYNMLIRAAVVQRRPKKGVEALSMMLNDGLTLTEETITQLLYLCAIRREDCDPEDWMVLDPTMLSRSNRNDSKSRAGLQHQEGGGAAACNTVVAILAAAKAEGVDLGVGAFGAAIDVMLTHRQVKRAFALFEQIKNDGLRPDTPIYNALIGACLRGRQLTRGDELYRESRIAGNTPSHRTYEYMIAIRSREGETEGAMGLFHEMQRMGFMPTIHTFSQLIRACAANLAYYKNAFEYLQMAIAHGLRPDEETFVSLLYACARAKDLGTAAQLMKQLPSFALAPTPRIFITYLSVIARSQSKEVVEVDQRQVTREDRAKMADEIAAQLQVDLNLKLANLLLSVYTNGLLESRACALISKMSKEGLKFDARTYALMTRMFAMMKRPEDAVEWLDKMITGGVPPDAKLFKLLLTTCKLVRNIDLGKLILEKARKQGISGEIGEVAELFASTIFDNGNIVTLGDLRYFVVTDPKTKQEEWYDINDYNHPRYQPENPRFLENIKKANTQRRKKKPAQTGLATVKN